MEETGKAPLSELETSFGLLKGAARGDIAAQRALAMQAVGLVQMRPDIDPVTLLMDGLIFARMAACQGDTGDQGRVISMLALLGQYLSEAGDEASRSSALDHPADRLGHVPLTDRSIAER